MAQGGHFDSWEPPQGFDMDLSDESDAGNGDLERLFQGHGTHGIGLLVDEAACRGVMTISSEPGSASKRISPSEAVACHVLAPWVMSHSFQDAGASTARVRGRS